MPTKVRTTTTASLTCAMPLSSLIVGLTCQGLIPKVFLVSSITTY